MGAVLPPPPAHGAGGDVHYEKPSPYFNNWGESTTGGQHWGARATPKECMDLNLQIDTTASNNQTGWVHDSHGETPDGQKSVNSLQDQAVCQMVRGVLIVLTCFPGRLLWTFLDSCESFGCWTARVFFTLVDIRSAGLCFVSLGPENPSEEPRATPRNFDWGWVDYIGTQTHLNPKFSFSWEFHHFILKRLENAKICFKKKNAEIYKFMGVDCRGFQKCGVVTPANPHRRRPWERTLPPPPRNIRLAILHGWCSGAFPPWRRNKKQEPPSAQQTV